MSNGHHHPRSVRIAAGVAILFGLLTVASGGYVLFGGDQATQMAGQVVPFVLWFNFLAGFGYVVLGAGLLVGWSWAYPVSLALLAGTLIVLSAFTLHVLQGGAHEMRTVIALVFRTLVLAAITWIARDARGRRVAGSSESRHRF